MEAKAGDGVDVRVRRRLRELRMQHGLTLEYAVNADTTWASMFLAGLALVGVLGVSRLPRPKAFQDPRLKAQAEP